MDKDTQHHETIIIEGVTKDGKTFRPSDWAERMSGSLCTFNRKRRIVYSPLLRPAVQGGSKCVIIDSELKKTNPALYESILDFAKKNHLKMHKSTNSGN